MTRMCCVCRKIERKGQWQKKTPSGHREVTHVYCPECYDDLMDEIDRYALQKFSKSVYTVISAGQLQGT